MENAIFLSIAISILFVIIKMAEMKYIENELLPLKMVVRETIMVALCSFGAIYVFFEYKGKFSEWFGLSKLGGAIDILKPPEIFTDNPGF
jgi:hypothetical protein